MGPRRPSPACCDAPTQRASVFVLQLEIWLFRGEEHTYYRAVFPCQGAGAESDGAGTGHREGERGKDLGKVSTPPGPPWLVNRSACRLMRGCPLFGRTALSPRLLGSLALTLSLRGNSTVKVKLRSQLHHLLALGHIAHLFYLSFSISEVGTITAPPCWGRWEH